MEPTIGLGTCYCAFRDIRLSLHSTTCTADILNFLAKEATDRLGAEGAVIRVLNLKTGKLEFSTAYGQRERYLTKVSLSHEGGIADLRSLRSVLIIDDILEDSRIQYAEEAWDAGIRMVVVVPLTFENELGGVLRVFFTQVRDFSQSEMDFLTTCGACGGCAIERVRTLEARKSQYDQLTLQAQKLSAVGRMAAGIAHEINNPLAGILLYSTNLLKKVPEKSLLKEGLEIIVHETTRCGKIIQELLDFSRGGEPNKTLANINDIVEKALSILENEFRLHHITLEKDLCGHMPDILLDPNQIEQVLVNILLNAVEAIEDRGVIMVHSIIEPEKEWVEIEIADSGPGIPPEHISEIFEPFFSTKKSGTGLGLAVSYGIVRKHQGQIYVSSRPGRGSRFTIELPVLQAVQST
ncbi:GAF domain-containing protein [Candidatus Poribacteria bacterium]|nr:GAF domain-containing protein [Candidatus Poribacteria bacterium]